MTEDNYWNTPSGNPQGPEPPVVNPSQPTEAIKSGTTETMPPVSEQDAQSHQGYAYSNPKPSQSYSYQNTAPAPKKGSAAKTFLFGFLGALLACVLAFGGFTAWQNTQNNASRNNIVQNDTTLGSTDPSVINAIDEGQTLAEAVAAKALPSVVYIGVYTSSSNLYSMYGYNMGGSQSNELVEAALGSGVVLTEDGYILTNYHVIEDAEAIKVTIEGVEYDAEVIGSDPSSDLAVIKAVDASGLTPADIGDSDSLVQGEWVMTVGSPFGLEQSVATGVVSATSRSRIVDDSTSMYGYGNSASEPTIYPNMIQTDAAINPGNSGGALVDADGKVIGINTLIESYSGNYSGVGFAIPINYAINIADQIIDGKTPTHAKLGVSLTNVTSSVAKRYNLPVDYGAYVSDVVLESGAYNAGIEAGDIIISFDGKKVETSTDLTLDVREHNPGDVVSIVVNRNGEERTFEVTLGSDDQQLASSSQGSSSGQEQANPNGNGSGNGYGYGNGGNSNNGNGYSYEDLLHYLGLL